MTKCSNFIEFARLETSQGHWAELIFSEDFCKGLLLDREKEIGKYATSTFPIRPLICPPPLPSPPKCITFVFHFSWVLQPSQEESKTMLKQNFGGGRGKRCIMGNVEKWRIPHRRILSNDLRNNCGTNFRLNSLLDSKVAKGNVDPWPRPRFIVCSLKRSTVNCR